MVPPLNHPWNKVLIRQTTSFHVGKQILGNKTKFIFVKGAPGKKLFALTFVPPQQIIQYIWLMAYLKEQQNT